MIRLLLSTTLALAASVSLVGSGVCAAEESPASGTGALNQEMREHPRFHKAIEELHAAIHQLKAAPHDFGGHREEAIQACETAIAQLKQAMAFDKAHEGAAKPKP